MVIFHSFWYVYQRVDSTTPIDEKCHLKTSPVDHEKYRRRLKPAFARRRRDESFRMKRLHVRWHSEIGDTYDKTKTS